MTERILSKYLPCKFFHKWWSFVSEWKLVFLPAADSRRSSRASPRDDCDDETSTIVTSSTSVTSSTTKSFLLLRRCFFGVEQVWESLGGGWRFRPGTDQFLGKRRSRTKQPLRRSNLCWKTIEKISLKCVWRNFQSLGNYKMILRRN